MYARLSDNTLVFLREIRADDKAAARRRAWPNLSEESVHKRFLGPKPYAVGGRAALPDRGRRLRPLRDRRRADEDDERIVAVARFVRLADDPRAAEAAITVCDELQGKGLGSLLARRLSDAARERGVERLTASIASENRPALKLMRKIDERLSGAPVGRSVSELVAQLPVRRPTAGRARGAGRERRGLAPQ